MWQVEHEGTSSARWLHSHSVCIRPTADGHLLVGGDKRDRWSSWYQEMIPVADRLFDEHLETLQREEETHDPH